MCPSLKSFFWLNFIAKKKGKLGLGWEIPSGLMRPSNLESKLTWVDLLPHIDEKLTKHILKKEKRALILFEDSAVVSVCWMDVEQVSKTMDLMLYTNSLDAIILLKAFNLFGLVLKEATPQLSGQDRTESDDHRGRV